MNGPAAKASSGRLRFSGSLRPANTTTNAGSSSQATSKTNQDTPAMRARVPSWNSGEITALNSARSGDTIQNVA